MRSAHAICNALSGWWKHNVGIQVLWDLMTIARQPGETAASALKLSHIKEKLQVKCHQYITYVTSLLVYIFTTRICG